MNSVSSGKNLAVRATIASAIVLSLYLVNYVLTPRIIGNAKLEQWCRPKFKMEFDPVRWKSSGIESGTRYQMVDDLLASGRLVGRPGSELESVLGVPNVKWEDDDTEFWSYSLARRRDYPARSWLFPGYFINAEGWVLDVLFTNRNVLGCRIRGS